MNKKLFFSMFAATGMLLTTSCSNDELATVQSDEKVQVTFSLGVEDGIGSRAAISDGTNINKLVYGVFDSEGNPLNVLEVNGEYRSQKVDEVNNITTTPHNISITLAKGQSYQVAFWAQNANCKAYNTENLKEVTVSYKNENNENAANNDDLRDAFFKTVPFEVNGNKTIDVVLQRPFAQINVGVTQEDWEAAIRSGINVMESSVVIYNAATKINLLDGSVSDADSVTYSFAKIPAQYDTPEALEVDVNKNGTIEEDEKYKWLSMSYILVNDEATGNAGATLEGLKYTFKPENGKKPIEFSKGLAGAPVQRNWRTNIVGRILTGDVNFNITVDNKFENSNIYPNKSEQELQLAATFGGTVTLTENVELTAPLNVTADMILNMNGKTISGNWHKNNGPVIKNDATLTIKGGTISSLGENGGSAVQNNGTMVIEGVALNGAPNANGSWPSYTVNNIGNLTINNSTITSYHGAVASYGDNAVVILNNSTIDMTGIPGFTSHGIYTYNNGKVIVNGGTYVNNATDQATSGASVINGAVEVTAGNFSGRIENYYGTPVLKGGTYSVKPNDNFIASGYKAIEKNGLYYVVAATVDAVASTPAEVLSTMKVENQTVCIVPTADGSAHKLEGKMSLAKGVSLIGMGDEPVALFNDWGSNAFANQAHFTNTTVENISFTNNLVIDAGIANGDVYFKNCVFGGELAHQGVHFDSGNATIVFDNCTFVGRNMFGSSLTKVIFNNCTFLNKKSSLTGADKWTGVNMWGKYEFNNCVFDTEATCNVKANGVEAVFTNCKYVDNRDISTVINNSPNYSCNIDFI